ncbi:hypothetical protein GCM10009665_47460 [Kitasatospora nipponensis]|uniref:Transcriptional regulator with AbiEi antitoxin domain of type IV toxin-antitoxin system n=1 Tax=Kitasatospora nipponensis TaxID=258049 RepID=A0ABP4H6K5_9ACTN
MTAGARGPLAPPPATSLASPFAPAWQPLGEAAEQWADSRATGALHTATGTVYLERGAVVHAESPQAPGLARLLTTCGRIPPQSWQQTVERFGAERRVGRMLVEQGWLTQGELELCHLGALYDAAYFALGTLSRTTSFEPGVRHWLGAVNAVSPRRLRRETVRRRDLLERIWPWPQLDTAPVVRCARPARTGPRPSPRQRELLDHADGRRTPADLARLLGRSAFATTVEVRRLAACGAVATPFTAPLAPLTDRRPADHRPTDLRPADPRLTPQWPTEHRRPIEQRPTEQRPTDRPVDRPVERPAADAPRTAPRGTGGHRTAAGLERRTPGALVPGGASRSPGGAGGAAGRAAPPAPHRPEPSAANPLTVHDPDIALLYRVRTALEARL